MKERGLRNMKDYIYTSVYECKYKDYIRVLANFNDEIVSLFWIRLGKDGSVYIAPSKKEIKQFRKGFSSARNGVIDVSYDEGEVLDNLSQLQSKTSFHSSGIINSTDSNRTFRNSLREINEQEELCRFLFQHPSQLHQVDKIKKRDIDISFYLEEDHPLMALVSVAPLNKITMINVDGVKNQSNIVLEYKGLDSCQDLAIQINILSLKVGNQWPPYTYMLYPVKSK